MSDELENDATSKCPRTERRPAAARTMSPAGRVLRLAVLLLVVDIFFSFLAPPRILPHAAAQTPSPGTVERGDLVELGEGVTPPKVVQLRPRFPETARRLHKYGATVALEVLIDENGKILEIRRPGELAGFGFDQEAERAVRHGIFEPACVGEVPVKVWWPVTVIFEGNALPRPAVALPPSPPAPGVKAGEPVELDPGDTPPRLVELKARFPETARKHGSSGATVTIEALIDENGKVQDVRSASPRAGFGFDAAAEQAVREAVFEPARKNGRPVSVWYSVVVKFVP